MNTIHPLSQSQPIAELNAFTVPATQTSIIRYIKGIYRPLTTLDGAQVLEFEAPSAVDEFFRFDTLKFYIKYKFTSKTSPPNWNTVKPVNYLMHSMIKNIDVYLGDTLVVSSQNYPYIAYFEGKLANSVQAKKGWMKACGWYDDIKDEKAVEAEKAYELYGPLHIDLSLLNNLFVGGLKLKICIHLNKPEFYLLDSGNTAITNLPQLKILESYVSIRRAKVYPAIVEAFETALNMKDSTGNDATARYALCRRRIKAFNIENGVQNVSFPNVVSGKLPRLLVIGFMKNSIFNGEIKSDPFTFSPENVNFLVTTFNGYNYPELPYQPNYDENIYKTVATALSEELRDDNSDPRSAIDFEEFKKSFTVYAINYAPDLNYDCRDGCTNLIDEGTLDIFVKFNKPTSYAVTMIVYELTDKILEIDKYRNVKFDLN